MDLGVCYRMRYWRVLMTSKKSKKDLTIYLLVRLSEVVRTVMNWVEIC